MQDALQEEVEDDVSDDYFDLNNEDDGEHSVPHLHDVSDLMVADDVWDQDSAYIEMLANEASSAVLAFLPHVLTLFNSGCSPARAVGKGG